MATSIIKSPFVERGNTLAYSVDIKDYTSSNKYTAPVDGYVWARTTTACTIYLPSVSQSVRAINSADTDGSVFVQKGTEVYVGGAPTYAYFRAYKYL